MVWESYVEGPKAEIRARVLNADTGSGRTSEDILLSTKESSGNYNPIVAATEEYGIAIWKTATSENKFDIRGQVLMRTGEKLEKDNDDFLISTTNKDMQFNHNVTASRNNAFAAWYSYDNEINHVLRGRVINISSGSGVGNDFIISEEDVIPETGVALEVYDETEVLAVWQAGNKNTGYELRAKLLDMKDGKGSYTFSVSDKYLEPLENFQLKINEKNAFIVLEYFNGTDTDIYGSILDIENEYLVVNDFILTMNTNGNQSMPQLATFGEFAVVTWDSNANGDKYDIYARVFNMKNGVVFGEDIKINQSYSAGDQVYPLLAINENGNVIFVWDSLFDNSMRMDANFIDLN